LSCDGLLYGPNALFLFRFFRDIPVFDEIRDTFLDSLFASCGSAFGSHQINGLLLLLMSITRKPYPGLVRNLDCDFLEVTLRRINVSNTGADPQLLARLAPLYFGSAQVPFCNSCLAGLLYTVASLADTSTGEVRSFFAQLLAQIGDGDLRFADFLPSAEAVWICRKTLTENSPAKQVLLDLINSVEPHSPLRVVIGIFAVLGSNFEKLSDYSYARYCPNLTTEYEYIIVSSNDRKFAGLPRPVTLAKPAVQLALEDQKRSYIYVYPRIAIAFEDFSDAPYVLNFHDFFSNNNAVVQYRHLYAQTVAQFMKSSTFAKLIPETIVSYISRFPVPFQDIHNAFPTLQRFHNFPSLPENSGFSYVAYARSHYVSYFSPVINPAAPPFEVAAVFAYAPRCSNGIVSDHFDCNYARYVLLNVPEMDLYPLLEHFDLPPPPHVLRVAIDHAKRQFVFASPAFPFPPGKAFRYMVGCTVDDYITFEASDFSANFFVESTSPLLNQGLLDADNTSELFSVPVFARNYAQWRPKPAVPADYKFLVPPPSTKSRSCSRTSRIPPSSSRCTSATRR
jgi:hypothetical protein